MFWFEWVLFVCPTFRRFSSWHWSKLAAKTTSAGGGGENAPATGKRYTTRNSITTASKPTPQHRRSLRWRRRWRHRRSARIRLRMRANEDLTGEVAAWESFKLSCTGRRIEILHRHLILRTVTGLLGILAAWHLIELREPSAWRGLWYHPRPLERSMETGLAKVPIYPNVPKVTSEVNLFTAGSLHDISFITEQVSNLFTDSNVWPSQRTGYYLGLLPRLVPPSHTSSIMHSRLAHHSHTLAIQLAGRIWGLVRQTSRNSNRQQRARTTLSLPIDLSALFHTRSYPPFTITFSWFSYRFLSIFASSPISIASEVTTVTWVTYVT
jgi:hypothetical protein